MTLVMETFNSASIGLSKLHFAKMTNKGSASAYPTYDPLVRIDGLVNGTITPNSDVSSDFADNRVHENLISYGAADISLEVTGLGPAGYEYVTGRVVSSDGGTVMMAGQDAPTLASVFEVLNGQRKRVRYVVYDCIFPEGEAGFNTKGENIEFGHVPLEGKIADLLFEGEIKKLSDGTSIMADGIRFMTMTEGGVDFDKTKWDAWFTTVQFPSGGASVPAADFASFSFAAGTENATILTVTSAVAESFKYVVGQRSTPIAGATIDEGTVIATAGSIAAVQAGQYISVYGLDAQGKVVSFGTHKLLASEIGS